MKTYSHSERRKLRESGDLKHGTFKTDTLRSPLSTPTKKKKREQFYAALQHAPESFVVKLFDRSLDLSKYTENTPLYPICRAWIANQPRNTNLAKFKTQVDREAARRQNNGAEILRKIQKGEPIIVNSMPAALNIEVSKTSDIDQHVKPNLAALDEALNNQDEKQTELVDQYRNELLTEHKLKWKMTKSKWASHAQDKRYELNQLIIKKLYKN